MLDGLVGFGSTFAVNRSYADRELVLSEGDEVALMINGLGGTPISELYICYGRAHQGLADRGINVTRSYVGEYCTSLDMAGASLTLVKLARKQLRAGHQLLIFPEGTRTVTPPVNEFKAGFLLIARQAGVPVQTVFIESDSRYLSKGWSLFRKPDLPLVYRARLGRRFEVPRDLHAFATELEDYFRRELTTNALLPANTLPG